MEIRSKREFYQLWEEGYLGNRTRLFHTLDEALASGASRVGFREITQGGGKWERAERPEQIPEIYHRWVVDGKPFIMDDGVPNHRSRMQGEMCRTFEGIQGVIALGYGLPPMRLSIAQGLHTQYARVAVRILMQQFMDPSSQDDIDILLDLYPDATIEFTCFDVNVGHLPGRNTMIWEVRNY
jgi:hypothetical protein